MVCVVSHPDPHILECEVKWALGSTAVNKASGGDGIPTELFKILKDDAVKVLHSICQQIWKTQQWSQNWKRSILIPIPRRRQWHLTPVLLPGNSHGRRSLVGCSPWGREESTELSDFTFMRWRRQWHPTPVFLPGESQGRGSLVGCSPWGHTESDTTEAT